MAICSCGRAHKSTTWLHNTADFICLGPGVLSLVMFVHAIIEIIYI